MGPFFKILIPGSRSSILIMGLGWGPGSGVLRGPRILLLASIGEPLTKTVLPSTSGSPPPSGSGAPLPSPRPGFTQHGQRPLPAGVPSTPL